MKIVGAEVFVTCPGRNFVTLKITTDEAIVGLGDATLNGRELSGHLPRAWYRAWRYPAARRADGPDECASPGGSGIRKTRAGSGRPPLH